MPYAAGPRAAKDGHRVVAFERIDSTNSEALRRARDGERGPLWVVAQEQSAGRGRRGRAWISLRGNLSATLLKTARLRLCDAATLGFVAGLAAYDACRACAPDAALALKWPNDLLANGRKLAGILLESQDIANRLAVAVGFGINLASAPADTAYPATSLASLGCSVSPEVMLAHLTDAFAEYDALWDDGRGFAAVRKLWLERAHGLGAPISVQIGNRIERGIFETLDETGRLILRGAGDTAIAIAAGDVYFGEAATARARTGVA